MNISNSLSPFLKSIQLSHSYHIILQTIIYTITNKIYTGYFFITNIHHFLCYTLIASYKYPNCSRAILYGCS